MVTKKLVLENPTRNMKIILICNSFTNNMKEATNITTINFAQRLKMRGNKVWIVAEGRKGFCNYEEVMGIPVYRSCNKLAAYPLIGKIIAKIISIPIELHYLKLKRIYPDIVHSFSSAIIISLNGVIAKLIFSKCKIIHTLKSKSASGIGNKFYFLLRKFDAVTIATNKMKRELIYNSISRNKIYKIPSHIDTIKFSPANKKELKQIYGLGGKVVILHYGAMRDDKGTYDLFQSMPWVVKEFKNVIYMYICRFDNIDPKYPKFLLEHNLVDNVKIITSDVKIEDYVKLADLAIFPYQTLTRTESNPSCVLECMSSKTPVITTNLEELSEILRFDERIIFPTNNIKKIVDTTILMLKNPKLRTILAESNFKNVKKYDVNKITSKFLNLYITLKIAQ